MRTVKRTGGLRPLEFPPVMECELLSVQITLTDSGLLCARLYENRRCCLGDRGEKAFQKEHLVIFFNPLQLEIRYTIIKLQLLWLPTFAPAAVFTLHIQSQFPLHLHSPLLLFGDSVLLLHPRYHACKCALLGSLCRSRRAGTKSVNTLYFFPVKTSTFENKWINIDHPHSVGSSLGHEWLDFYYRQFVIFAVWAVV